MTTRRTTGSRRPPWVRWRSRRRSGQRPPQAPGRRRPTHLPAPPALRPGPGSPRRSPRLPEASARAPSTPPPPANSPDGEGGGEGPRSPQVLARTQTAGRLLTVMDAAVPGARRLVVRSLHPVGGLEDEARCRSTRRLGLRRRTGRRAGHARCTAESPPAAPRLRAGDGPRRPCRRRAPSPARPRAGPARGRSAIAARRRRGRRWPGVRVHAGRSLRRPTRAWPTGCVGHRSPRPCRGQRGRGSGTLRPGWSRASAARGSGGCRSPVTVPLA